MANLAKTFPLLNLVFSLFFFFFCLFKNRISLPEKVAYLFFLFLFRLSDFFTIIIMISIIIFLSSFFSSQLLSETMLDSLN